MHGEVIVRTRVQHIYTREQYHTESKFVAPFHNSTHKVFLVDHKTFPVMVRANGPHPMVLHDKLQ